MADLQNDVFMALFREAFSKCFHVELQKPLTESESRHFANNIFETTGLIIGAKSIKNYSSYIAGTGETKRENPSVATLDTFARYVMNAPYTDEISRKAEQGQYAYWFQYRATFIREHGFTTRPAKRSPSGTYLVIIAATALIALLLFFILRKDGKEKNIVENFHSVNDDTLSAHGWFVLSKDPDWWNKKNEMENGLTLFTLPGDNWPDSTHKPVIKNLLLQKIGSDCFSAEVHMNNFVPGSEWQQAGLLLMEDTNYSGKCIRISIAYNDFFGGFKKPDEIILQAITTGGIDFTRPEEMGHLTLFSKDESDSLIHLNMQHSALRIEKNGNHFRFLYSTGSSDNNALKEAFSRDLKIQPKYIGIFALEGFVRDTIYMPVHFNYFSLVNTACDQ
ncbi:MAG TPA: hypothetical protein VG847_03165 [Chitinophagaceae bacterium]|nr:hypothetical protein [Chitinophagaceae bacterium]